MVLHLLLTGFQIPFASLAKRNATGITEIKLRKRKFESTADKKQEVKLRRPLTLEMHWLDRSDTRMEDYFCLELRKRTGYRLHSYREKADTTVAHI